MFLGLSIQFNQCLNVMGSLRPIGTGAGRLRFAEDGLMDSSLLAADKKDNNLCELKPK